MRSKTLQRLMLLSVGLLPLACGTQGSAQIPSSRVTDWHNSGVIGGIPKGGTEILATNHGVVANGVTDNSAAIQALVNSAASLNKVIKFPAGTIRCESRINFPVEGQRVIRGTLSPSGEKLTKFHFNTGSISGDTGNFNVRAGTSIGAEIAVNHGYTKGSRQLTLANVIGLAAGDYIELRQENDRALMNTGRPKLTWAEVGEASWYKRVVGQLFKIANVNGNVVTLEKPLRLDYKAELEPKVQKFIATQRVGFEDFYIESLQDGSKSGISFQRAANCWVKNIHSYKSVAMHVNALQSLNLTVRDSYFDDAWNHGSGGNGYGVVMSLRSGDSLVENNEFKRLRHSMLTGRASNGNVFGYNRSYETINIYYPHAPSVDISIHGHFSYMNLFEGNEVEWIHSADWWGPSGPGTTFFRNRVTRWDLELNDRSVNQNVVGNEVIASNKTVKVDPSVINPFIHGNKVQGSYSWAPDAGTDNVQNSYYLTQKPAFLPAKTPWPLYGPPAGIAFKPAD
jgi:hypothetical protein